MNKKIVTLMVLGVTAVLTLIFLNQPSQAAPAAPTANTQSAIGSNLAGIADWSGEMPFLDVFKSARQWIPQCVQGSDPGCNDGGTAWDTGEFGLLDMDSDGWIRSLPAPGGATLYTRVSAVMLSNPDVPAGQYIVLYDGEGTIEYSLGAQKNVGLSAPGRDVIDVTPSNGLSLLTISSTDPGGTGNYIRNIRVILPGLETLAQTQRFNPAFLTTIANYRAIRFMDWGATNDNGQSDWGERPLPSHTTFATNGVPVEVMVELVNQLNADPWFTLPHQASDDYMTQYATLVRDTLNPQLQVYVEYSNEVWNDGFSQGGWVEAQGQAEWPSDPSSGFTKRMNWYGKRTAEMCDIWKTVWGTQSDRVVCVMASQAANSWTASEPLACPLWSGGPCVDHGIDASAIAPYFGGYLGTPGWESTLMGWTAEADGGMNSLFAELTNTAVPEALVWVTAHKTVADQNGLDLIAYEGGQHLTGVFGVENNDAVTTLFTTANRDARMGGLYTTYLDGWRQNGGQLFAHYLNADGFTKWGSWGALEYTNQGSSPKYDALMAFITANPCWWPGCTAVTLDQQVYLPVVIR
ncbi:MAG: cellulose-binding protein [Ardenticatenaceae bacterium]|nr:hypothetical protein [Anaerolineales bacterium]MCB8921548.1 cellulose-binding protein [Ardenticatenaceae bacterium]MCB8991465.1 cellulose-binding protein [Ardenticatenaceae bacterium]MCB9003915.1 cellulose-binding protein [Ardenticatenaceae bacterium]